MSASNQTVAIEVWVPLATLAVTVVGWFVLGRLQAGVGERQSRIDASLQAIARAASRRQELAVDAMLAINLEARKCGAIFEKARGHLKMADRTFNYNAMRDDYLSALAAVRAARITGHLVFPQYLRAAALNLDQVLERNSLVVEDALACMASDGERTLSFGPGKVSEGYVEEYLPAVEQFETAARRFVDRDFRNFD